jgi:hypothetical protein
MNGNFSNSPGSVMATSGPPKKIIQLGLKYNVDKIYLNKITDWNTIENFKEQAVWMKSHKENKNLLDIIDKIKKIKFKKDFFLEYSTLILI